MVLSRAVAQAFSTKKKLPAGAAGGLTRPSKISSDGLPCLERPSRRLASNLLCMSNEGFTRKHPAPERRSRHSTQNPKPETRPPSSEYGTCKTVTARLWPWLAGSNPPSPPLPPPPPPLWRIKDRLAGRLPRRRPRVPRSRSAVTNLKPFKVFLSIRTLLLQKLKTF